MEKKLYEKINIGGVELRARLGVKDAIELERALGCSLISIMKTQENAEDVFGSFDFICKVITYSLRKYENEYTYDKVCDLIETDIDNGKQLADFIQIVIAILEVSGFFRNTAQQ